MFFRILSMQYVAKLKKKFYKFHLGFPVISSEVLKLNIYFVIFIFFSKYIATFIYHAFYCIAIAQVRIIQEDRRERDEKRNKYLCRGLVVTVSEWEEGGDVGRGGGWIRIALLLVNIPAA